MVKNRPLIKYKIDFYPSTSIWMHYDPLRFFLNLEIKARPWIHSPKIKKKNLIVTKHSIGSFNLKSFKFESIQILRNCMPVNAHDFETTFETE